MKLILSSENFSEYPKIKDKFLGLLGKPTSKAKILMHSTVQKAENEEWVKLNKQILVDIGIKLENITHIDAEQKISYEEAKKHDVIYFCGGNTYYLLDAIRRTGFDEIIREFVKEPNKLYFGISAGSMIMGPNIECSIIGGNTNEVGLKDLTALNIIDTAIIVHAEKKDSKELKEFIEKADYKITVLKDGQALLVVDGKQEIIE